MENDSADEDRPLTWRERHFTSLMGGVLGILLALVVINQVAC